MGIYKNKRKKLNTGRESIVFDVRPMLALRGITRPFEFFKSHKLSKDFISACADGTVKSINNAQIEKLCTALKCNPGDLFVYKGEEITDTKHYLFAFSNRNKTLIDNKNYLMNKSVEELRELG